MFLALILNAFFLVLGYPIKVKLFLRVARFLFVLVGRSMMKFNTRFSRPVVPGVVARGGLTDQHQKDDCDLNKILRRYRVGNLPPAPAGRFEDLTQAPKDLQDAFDKVQQAVEWFDGLPSDVRRRYGNDPRQAIAAVMSGTVDDIAALFPDVKQNHSQAAEAATPEPRSTAEVPATAGTVDGESPADKPAS